MNIRYQLCPQMKIYDQLRYNRLPNVMFCQEPNYRSKILNTDKYGLRFNSEKDSILSLSKRLKMLNSYLEMMTMYFFFCPSQKFDNLL